MGLSYRRWALKYVFLLARHADQGHLLSTFNFRSGFTELGEDRRDSFKIELEFKSMVCGKMKHD